MTGVDHRLPPIPAQRSKAFDKKSRSTTSWPILACSFVSSASRFRSRSKPFSSKTLASFSIASRFQAAILVGCSSCLLASSATVWWPWIASSATLALNSPENRLRVLMMDRPLHRRIHLSWLSQEVGPPLGLNPEFEAAAEQAIIDYARKDAKDAARYKFLVEPALAAYRKTKGQLPRQVLKAQYGGQILNNGAWSI